MKHSYGFWHDGRLSCEAIFDHALTPKEVQWLYRAAANPSRIGRLWRWVVRLAREAREQR